MVKCEVHIEVETMTMRRRIEIPYEMLRRLVTIYAQARIWSERFIRIEEFRFDEQIGDRTLGMVADSGGGQLFIEVRVEEASPEFVEEYFQFCQRYSPSEAWLVAPASRREDRKLNPKMVFENRWLISFFRIIPVGEVLENLYKFYRLRFEEKDGRPVLTLDPTLTQATHPTFQGLP